MFKINNLFLLLIVFIFGCDNNFKNKFPLQHLPNVPIGSQELTGTPLSQGTIFIAPNGKGNKCTQKEPCAIQGLDNGQRDIQPKAGDVVFFRGGIYKYNMQNLKRIYLPGGSEKKPIIYESYPGELAIFDGSALDIQHKEKKEWREGRLELRDNHTILRKIEVRNLPQYGIRILGNHNIVEGCIVHHNHLSGIEVLNKIDGYSTKSTAGSFNIIRHNIIHNNSDAGLHYGNYNLGGNADGVTIHSGVANLITHNTIYANSDDGIDTFKSMYSKVTYNLVYAQGKHKGNANGIKLGGTDNKLGLNASARHNIVYANKGFGITVHGKENNISIEYNTAFDNKKAGYAILDDTRLNHNIAAQNQKGNVVWSKGREQRNNSWQKENLTIRFQSFNPHSNKFLKPFQKDKIHSIGAY